MEGYNERWKVQRGEVKIGKNQREKGKRGRMSVLNGCMDECK